MTSQTSRITALGLRVHLFVHPDFVHPDHRAESTQLFRDGLECKVA